MLIPKTLHEENVHSNCLMGLIFSTSWRVAPTKTKMRKKTKIAVGVYPQDLPFQALTACRPLTIWL